MPISITGRKQEMVLLHQIYNRNEPDFLALYGRRRVGKTYLIRNYFNKLPCIYFEATGLKDGSMQDQLKLFAEKISVTFSKDIPLQTPANWLEAFNLLTMFIEQIPKNKKIILFLDELPWFATQKSGFIQALDHYWNTRWSTRQKLKLIVCGSAASWMLENLIHAKGGLHNRLTAVMVLRPFSLYETEEFFHSRGIKLNRRQILNIYMAIGGIPHYLNSIQRGLSAAQNINQLCFHKDGILFKEFHNLFASLFDDSAAHLELIRLIAHSRQGIDRDKLLKKAKYSSSGGTFKSRLNELEEAGFIASFTPYGYRNKGTFYRVTDEYTLFFLHWIEPVAQKLKVPLKSTTYWESKMQTQTWKSWSGYSFEAICLKHIEQIKRALGLQSIATEIGSWRYLSKNPEESGVQIDLLIDRADGIVNLCEIKYCQGKFILTKSYGDQLTKKIELYQTHVQPRKTIFLTLITPEGVHKNNHTSQLIANEITLDDLYEKS